MITETNDRWIVPARGRVLTDVEVGPTRQSLLFTGGLQICFEGDGQILRGPATKPGRRPADSENLPLLIGQNLRSLVLFKQGSLRGVFSNGDRLTLAVTAVSRMWCSQPARFAFQAVDGVIEMDVAEEP